jgi:hypothetical protein
VPNDALVVRRGGRECIYLTTVIGCCGGRGGIGAGGVFGLLERGGVVRVGCYMLDGPGGADGAAVGSVGEVGVGAEVVAGVLEAVGAARFGGNSRNTFAIAGVSGGLRGVARFRRRGSHARIRVSNLFVSLEMGGQRAFKALIAAAVAARTGQVHLLLFLLDASFPSDQLNPLMSVFLAWRLKMVVSGR